MISSSHIQPHAVQWYHPATNGLAEQAVQTVEAPKEDEGWNAPI